MERKLNTALAHEGQCTSMLPAITQLHSADCDEFSAQAKSCAGATRGLQSPQWGAGRWFAPHWCKRGSSAGSGGSSAKGGAETLGAWGMPALNAPGVGFQLGPRHLS